MANSLEQSSAVTEAQPTPTADPLLCKQFKRLSFAYLKSWDNSYSRQTWLYICGLGYDHPLFPKLAIDKAGPLFRYTRPASQFVNENPGGKILTYEEALKRCRRTTMFKVAAPSKVLKAPDVTTAVGKTYCQLCQHWHADSPCLKCQDGKHQFCTGFWFHPNHVPCKCACKTEASVGTNGNAEA